MFIDSATQQSILFFVQIASLIFLIIYVVKTWEMASATRKAAEATEKSVLEMRETRDQETAPFIIAYFDVQTEASLIYLVVKNIGRTVATQVKLSFTPELQSSNDNGLLKEVGFIKNGIESMPPNYEIRTLVDSSPGYFGKNELPLKYNVEITYYGGIESKQRTANQQLDLSANKGVSYVRNKTMNNLVDVVEKLTREIREIRNFTSDIATALEHGILISNGSLLVTKIEPDLRDWKKYLVAKLNEFENLWTVYYRNEREQGIGLGKLQAHAQMIGEQILIISANNTGDVPADVHEKTELIAGKLQELGQITFYIDGGVSLKKFKETGDSIIIDINDFLTKNS